jgi:hypothetical protein
MSCFTVANCWFSVWEQLHELMIDAIEAIIGVLHEDVDSRFEPVDLSFQAPEVFPHLALIAFQKQDAGLYVAHIGLQALDLLAQELKVDVLGHAATLSQVQHQPRRVLQRLLDPHEEGHRLAAVDDPVIIGEGEVHHRAHHHLSAPDDRALLDPVHAENA